VEKFAADELQTCFSNAVTELEEMCQETEREMHTLAENADLAQQEYKPHLKKLNLNLKTVFRKFRRLETRISTVSHTAVRIGSTLETVDAQKGLDKDGLQLIQLFMAFNKGGRECICCSFKFTCKFSYHVGIKCTSWFRAQSHTSVFSSAQAEGKKSPTVKGCC
jgi:hypothetical protein